MGEHLHREEDYKSIIQELKEKSERLRQKSRDINLKLQQVQEELNNMLGKLNPKDWDRAQYPGNLKD